MLSRTHCVYSVRRMSTPESDDLKIAADATGTHIEHYFWSVYVLVPVSVSVSV